MARPVKSSTQPYALLGARIRQAREQRGLTQREFAPLVHISYGYLTHIERGRARPDAAILQRIAAELNLDYGELARLANYIPVTAIEDADTAADISRFAALPRDLRKRILRIADAFVDYNPVTPTQQSDDQRQE